ncbi:MAG: D-tyrosyl-tRNA(Tyr) deacylase [Magnetococcales bacterium]|nr:D-tyrosyl-tRNA(Tyr) deacylase [Magnetococcales bacterium]
MKSLLQRVTRAEVRVADQVVGQIAAGVVVFVAVERGDQEGMLHQMAERIVRLRMFSDDAGRMNRSLLECGGAALVVSQFTLAADLAKGHRPSFSRAEAPDRARHLYHQFCLDLAQQGVEVAQGVFGADMQVDLVNDGPVTFWLE